MATTKKFFIFATFWLACGAAALLVTSYSTNAWVIADLGPTTDNGFIGHITYGMFSGSFEKKYGQTSKLYNIYITCAADQNKCAWSCWDTPEKRLEELHKLIENQENLGACGPLNTTSKFRNFESEHVQYSRIKNMPSQKKSEAMILIPKPLTVEEFKDPSFVNMGLWVCTLMSLSIALLVTLFSALLGLLNTASNPKSTVFAVKGLFYWNGLAAVLDLLTLILWGSQFAVTLIKNVALAEVINGDFTSKDRASLGYSYWLILVAMLVSIGNVVLLGIREYLLRHEPPPPAPQFDETKTDGVIFLY